MIQRLENTARNFAGYFGALSLTSEPGAHVVRRIFTGPEKITQLLYNGIEAVVDTASGGLSKVGGNLLDVAKDLSSEVSESAHYVDVNINTDSEASMAIVLGTYVGAKYGIPLFSGLRKRITGML